MTQLATVNRSMEISGNGEDDLPAQASGAMQVAMTRAAQEVQAAMVIAKRFPRDEERAFARIMTSCKRRSLAEQGIYSFPRGGSTVEGPSIRLAEVLAQAWGNIESGIMELERRDGVSTAMAYCWDLETNTRDVKVFEVRHIRDRSDRKGGNASLSSERDIYELIANMGSRRKRACILSVIPGDIVEAAADQCNQTLKSGSDGPIIDRIRAMTVAFGEYQVTAEMLESRLGHKLDVTTEVEVVALKKIYRALKDGAATRDEFFDPNSAGRVSDIAEKMAETAKGKPNGHKPKADPPAEPQAETNTETPGQTATAAATDDLSDYNNFYDLCAAAAMTHDISETDLRAKLQSALLAAGMVGKHLKTDLPFRQKFLASVRANFQ